MHRLQEAVRSLGLEAESALSGQWVKLQGEQCRVHVVEVGWGIYYNTWCEAPGDPSVHVYCDPVEAIEAGLRRAAGRPESDAGKDGAENAHYLLGSSIHITPYTDNFSQA